MGKYAYVYWSILFNVLGQLSIKWSMIKFGKVSLSAGNMHRIIEMFLKPYSILGLILYAISAVFWLAALSRVELSVAYPMLSIGYVLVFFLAGFLLGESMSIVKFGGIALIIAGIFMVTK